MNWNTAGNRERRPFHVACNPPSARPPIPCHDYRPDRVRRPVWRWRRRRCRRRRHRPHRRCTRRTASTTSCHSTAAWNPPGIGHLASPGIATSCPGRSAADLNAPSAHRVFKFPARNPSPANGTTRGQGGSRRCRLHRVSFLLFF